jgi:ubiquinone/menaquinone biosynthesis C-methylase UbiE
VVNKTGETSYDPIAKEFDFFVQTTSPFRYDKALGFLPQCASYALDAGCGSGTLTLRLAEHARYAVGIDISGSMIALAKKHQAEQGRINVDFVIADLEKLPFAAHSFDFVVSYNMLHYVQPDVTLPGLRRLVKPGGQMTLFNLVTSHPRLYASPTWQTLRRVMAAPRYLVSYGLRTTWRLVAFLINPAWLRIARDYVPLKPEGFKDVCNRFLPGCRCEGYHRWQMVAFWQASLEEE